ncbi:P-type DNA transfer ATPase VirB11 [Candidatus Fukatsuia symbiotica]|uniref:P-type DNA transfer ATPase VirB11 n=1 Tax=Candidatus Fukatsuia symbiotica TaxID=1878942 RepID=UPI002B24198C|nr:P-type DNA transfer ATPase VirB11 [Candidatus Fukatsuia symbiotica]MEA9446214.1 P-type DNA transfer ATPase VirB11 [Candidatus Fukatsuia symbiotica]
MADNFNSLLARDFLAQSGVSERLNRDGVTEVAINRPFEIWTESAVGWVQESLPALDYDLCWKLANSLSTYNHRFLSIQSPIKTVELPDGERGQIVIPPACEAGTISMTFRKPSLERFRLEDYASSGRFEKMQKRRRCQHALQPFEVELKQLLAEHDCVAFFKKAVQHKLNIIIFGGTGSGKTTFAKAVVDLFPHDRRMLTIEELNELKLPYHPNHVHLLYGDTVSPKELVSCCMRMKGDHIFLAELTGDEAWDFMELLNTGHPGTITTAHANDSLSGYARVCGLIKQAPIGLGLDYAYIERRVRTSFDAVMYMEGTHILEVAYEPEIKQALLNGGSLSSSLHERSLLCGK